MELGFEGSVRNTLPYCEWAFKGHSGEDSERIEESYGESLNLLREYISNLNRMLVEMCMIKAILMRSQTNCGICYWKLEEKLSW